MEKKFFKTIFYALSIVIYTGCFGNQSNQTIHQALLTAMKLYHVPVVGYAIIKKYSIVSSETLSIDTRLRVSKNSLFQAASISKSVTSYGALNLVSQQKLSLDEQANNSLKSWKIPVNGYNKNHPVKVKYLLNMTSGLSVSGFPGYKQGLPLPTLQQALNGELPSNTPHLRVLFKPGTQYYYSGGAFLILEQLIEDITKQSFSTWMKNEILMPIGMHNSLFQYPLNKKYRTLAVPGFLSNGTVVKGGWNNYAAAGAAGLWSTPTDLAKFVINASNAYLQKNNRIISAKVAKQMLTRQPNTDYGLGFVINGNGKNLNFRKAGHNLGYHSQLIMFPNSGDGLIIMANSENGEDIINYMIALISQIYHWPCYFPYFDELITIPEQAC